MSLTLSDTQKQVLSHRVPTSADSSDSLYDSVIFPRCMSKSNPINEPVHEISNNVVCAASKASDQTAHTRSLIRAFASRLSIQ